MILRDFHGFSSTLSTCLDTVIVISSVLEYFLTSGNSSGSGSALRLIRMWVFPCSIWERLVCTCACMCRGTYNTQAHTCAHAHMYTPGSPASGYFACCASERQHDISRPSRICSHYSPKRSTKSGPADSCFYYAYLCSRRLA